MELALFIYLAETICTKEGESGYAFLLGIFFVLSIVATILSRIDPKEFGNLAKLPLRTVIYVSGVLLVLFMITPSQKTAYTMLGAYGIQTFATTVYENEQAKRIAANSLNLVEAAISKYEKELSK
ncbi:hypothetical protein AhSzw1_26 [Aeromonas phage AhSzw-1]|uniref:Uncharacterized protein n=1 Tax=Aeromonas phage AhSzw-1 TaxID=2138299 RepID=A0A2R4ALZ5_9CAUD|nr:hypothetical protein HOT04_gp026 [Aeromonas phage AhSzw-1]AVR76062.1 hypothetical protein AhSzw1_26 [Aeromonas phage AhSzw-1]